LFVSARLRREVERSRDGKRLRDDAGRGAVTDHDVDLERLAAERNLGGRTAPVETLEALPMHGTQRFEWRTTRPGSSARRRLLCTARSHDAHQPIRPLQVALRDHGERVAAGRMNDRRRAVRVLDLTSGRSQALDGMYAITTVR
jgi:hypothetical protein